MGKRSILRLTLIAIVISFLGLAQSYALADTQTESMIKASLKASLKSLGLSRLAADADSPPPWVPGPPPWAPGPPHDPPGPPCGGNPPGNGCPVSPVR